MAGDHLGPPAEWHLQARVAELEDEVAHLQAALRNRPRIEHAVGMLMMLIPCTAQAALASLRVVSQNTNRKVRDVADLITDCVGAGQPLPPDLINALIAVLPPRARGSRRPLLPQTSFASGDGEDAVGC